MKTKSLFGISGQEEFLALKTLAKEEDQDDDGCNVEEEPEFDEDEYLDGVAEGAGYGPGCVANHETYL